MNKTEDFTEEPFAFDRLHALLQTRQEKRACLRQSSSFYVEDGFDMPDINLSRQQVTSHPEIVIALDPFLHSFLPQQMCHDQD